MTIRIKTSINSNQIVATTPYLLRIVKKKTLPGKDIAGAIIRMGITIKKIINNTCAVTTTWYNWWFAEKKVFPEKANSNLINTDKIVPKIPLNVPKIK